MAESQENIPPQTSEAPLHGALQFPQETVSALQSIIKTARFNAIFIRESIDHLPTIDNWSMASAYLNAAKKKSTGDVEVPIVLNTLGEAVAFGMPQEWATGVAQKILKQNHRVVISIFCQCQSLKPDLALIRSISNPESAKVTAPLSPARSAMNIEPVVRVSRRTTTQVRDTHIDAKQARPAPTDMDHSNLPSTCSSTPSPSTSSPAISPRPISPRRSSARSFKSGAAASKGIRDNMEDVHTIIEDFNEELSPQDLERFSSVPKQAFFAVYDGHCGIEAANLARDKLHMNIAQSESFYSSADSDMTKAIVAGYLETDKEILELSQSNSNSAGATASTVLIRNNMLYVANIGDSRVVLSRGGVSVDLTRDHTAKNLEDEVKRIQEAGGSVDTNDYLVGGILAVTRALGNFDVDIQSKMSGLIADPEVKTVSLQSSDEFIILACDGVWDVLTSQRAVDLVRKALARHSDPEKASRELVDEALTRHSQDNVTAVVVMFHRSITTTEDSKSRRVESENTTEVQTYTSKRFDRTIADESEDRDVGYRARSGSSESEPPQRKRFDFSALKAALASSSNKP